MNKSLKSSIGILALSLSLGVVGLVANPTTTQAAKWHKGTPKVLRGNWRTKMKKIKDGGKHHHWDYSYVKFTKSNAKGAYGTQTDGLGLTNAKYKSLGKNTYKVTGNWIGKQTWTIKKINSKKIRISMNGNKYSNFYKYSGKRSKNTFYPYP